MLYYGLVMLATVMFGLQFLCNEKYEDICGGGLRSAMLFAVLYNIPGVLILLVINGFKVGCTPFTLLMAGLNTLVTLLYTICSMKALGKINLSLFSVLAMLGGMIIPFLGGILFYEEELTLGKTVCFVLIAVALFITVERKQEKGGFWYYVGVFILNGASGILSKAFQSSALPKATEADYLIWSSVMALVSSLILLFLLPGEWKRPTGRAIFHASAYGILCRTANWLLLISLGFLPASAQYPMITGGVMIVSTCLCYIEGREKPRWRELAAVGVSFVGILALVLLP